MSVSSGVPVFRAADGTMSPDFLRFLDEYNAARRKAQLPEADDWFNFSVPEMFRAETAKEAWAYWRWRTLRARVEPGNDYKELGRLVDLFGSERVFVVTSNCDGLHESAGVSQDALYECHGSLARLQCSEPCSNEMWPADAVFLKQLRENPGYVPICPRCKSACLRPNVMIFGDGQLVEDVLTQQVARQVKFCEKFSIEETSNVANGGDQAEAVAAAGAAAAATIKTNTSNKKKSQQLNCVVLEVGAGTVVPSIRCTAEALGAQGQGLVRVNPSHVECEKMESLTNGEALKKGRRSSSSSGENSGGDESGGGSQDTRYWPFAMRSEEALRALCNELKLPLSVPSLPSSAATVSVEPATTSLQVPKLKVPKLTDFGNGASAAQSGT
jgi:NAD-dependent SIR2 family protein deacetylase